MPRTAKLQSDIEQAIVHELLTLEFVGDKRGGPFVRTVAAGVLGWIGLTYATNNLPGTIDIGPTVGIRHQVIERTIADILGEAWDSISPPTVSMNVGYLEPLQKYRQVSFGSTGGHARGAQEVVAILQRLGLPFIMQNVDIGCLVETLRSKRIWVEHAAFRLPLALLMAGKISEALDELAASDNRLRPRQDPGAERFRRFASVVRSQREACLRYV